MVDAASAAHCARRGQRSRIWPAPTNGGKHSLAYRPTPTMPSCSEGTGKSTPETSHATGSRRRCTTNTTSAARARTTWGSTDHFTCPSKRPTKVISCHRAFVVRNTSGSPVRSAQYTHHATTATTDGPATSTARRHDHHTATTNATASTRPLGLTSAAPTATTPAARSWCSSTSTNAHTEAARKMPDGEVMENTNDAGKKARDHTERAATLGPPRRDASRETPANASRNSS